MKRNDPMTPVRKAVAQVAAASRKSHGGTAVRVRDGALADAKARLVAARLQAAIDMALQPMEEGYEPLREEDRRRLADRLLSAPSVPLPAQAGEDSAESPEDLMAELL